MKPRAPKDQTAKINPNHKEKEEKKGAPWHALSQHAKANARAQYMLKSTLPESLQDVAETIMSSILPLVAMQAVNPMTRFQPQYYSASDPIRSNKSTTRDLNWHIPYFTNNSNLENRIIPGMLNMNTSWLPPRLDAGAKLVNKVRGEVIKHTSFFEAVDQSPVISNELKDALRPTAKAVDSFAANGLCVAACANRYESSDDNYLISDLHFSKITNLLVYDIPSSEKSIELELRSIINAVLRIGYYCLRCELNNMLRRTDPSDSILGQDKKYLFNSEGRCLNGTPKSMTVLHININWQEAKR